MLDRSEQDPTEQGGYVRERQETCRRRSPPSRGVQGFARAQRGSGGAENNGQEARTRLRLFGKDQHRCIGHAEQSLCTVRVYLLTSRRFMGRGAVRTLFDEASTPRCRALSMCYNPLSPPFVCSYLVFLVAPPTLSLSPPRDADPARGLRPLDGDHLPTYLPPQEKGCGPWGPLRAPAIDVPHGGLWRQTPPVSCCQVVLETLPCRSTRFRRSKPTSRRNYGHDGTMGSSEAKRPSGFRRTPGLAEDTHTPCAVGLLPSSSCILPIPDPRSRKCPTPPWLHGCTVWLKIIIFAS